MEHVANAQNNTSEKSKSQAELETLKEIKDLFASAHDLIAQAQYPGHAYQKIGSTLAFLKFQYNDFVTRVEKHEKAMNSTVDVEAAKAATEAVLSVEKEVSKAISDAATNPPKA